MQIQQNMYRYRQVQQITPHNLHKQKYEMINRLDSCYFATHRSQ